MSALDREARDAALLEMIQEGASYAEAGEAFGLTRQRVSQIAQSAGLSASAPAGRVESAIRLLEDAAGSMSLAEAARQAECHPESIRQRLKREGRLGEVRSAREAWLDRQAEIKAEGRAVSMVCRVCGLEKPASEMSKAKTAKGLPTRSNRCKSCTSKSVSKSRRKA